jgi:hypothetical protein
LTESSVEAAAKLVSERDAFVSWQGLTKDRFVEMQNGWEYSNLDKACKKLVGCVGTVVAKVVDDWTERGRQVAAELTTSTPPKLMIHNAKMLIDKPARQAFEKAVQAMFKSKLKDVAADTHEILKRAADAIKIAISSVKLLATARRTAKLAIVVNWAVDEILNHRPTAIEELAKHGATINAKLKLKGFVGKDNEDICAANLLCPRCLRFAARGDQNKNENHRYYGSGGPGWPANLAPPPFGRVSRPPGAAEIPQNQEFCVLIGPPVSALKRMMGAG